MWVRGVASGGTVRCVTVLLRVWACAQPKVAAQPRVVAPVKKVVASDRKRGCEMVEWLGRVSMDVSVGVKKTKICTLRNDELHSSTDEGPGETPAQGHGSARGVDDVLYDVLDVFPTQDDGCTGRWLCARHRDEGE